MAVAAELRARGAEVSFLGTRERIEADLVPAAGYEIDFLRVRGLDRGNPLRAAAAAAEALAAVPAAMRAIRRRRADVVMGGGGFVAGPAGLAAVLRRTPLVLTEADSHLGLANRLLAGRARRVCLAFPIAGREGERYVVTGRPVPAAVLAADRGAARARFGIAARRPLPAGDGGQPGRALDQRVRDRGAGRAARARLPRRPRLRAPRLRAAAGPPRRGTAARSLHAARLRAGPRRLPRRLRSGPRPLGRLDLRADRGRAARGARPLSACRGRPPERQRRLDGGGGGGDGDRRREAERRAARRRGVEPVRGPSSGWLRWRAPRRRWRCPTPLAASPTWSSPPPGRRRAEMSTRRRQIGPSTGRNGDWLGGATPALHRDRRRRDERPGPGLRPAGREGDRQRPLRLLVYGAPARRRPRAGRRPRRRQPARGGRSGRLDRDRRGQPGAGGWPASAASPVLHRGELLARALRREAADRGRRHARQDDDDRDACLGAAGARRRPRLLRRRRGAGPRAGRRGRQRWLGRRASGPSPRPTRATRASSS